MANKMITNLGMVLLPSQIAIIKIMKIIEQLALIIIALKKSKINNNKELMGNTIIQVPQ